MREVKPRWEALTVSDKLQFVDSRNGISRVIKN